ncbi:MAG: metallophosphoesterase family protein [Spirochaetaceae bacterium]|jgi:putative phosphoesterase|nr:metallophosphoesterase family protein [Spirochaetaceae bacterium]
MMPPAFSILLISDSHGQRRALNAALRWAVGAAPAIDAAVFLGDGADDLAEASSGTGFSAPWYKVRGNGDLDFSIPDTVTLTVPGGSSGTRRFFLTHGNRYRVDGNFQAITAAARNAGAEAAFFGHTHVPYWGQYRGIRLLNPGSIGRPRNMAGPSFAVLSCPAAGPLSVRFHGLVSRGQDLEVTPGSDTGK